MKSTQADHRSGGVSALLWVVNLCAICASTLSYVHLSYHLYVASGSVVLSQAVLFAPMVLPVILVVQIHRTADRTMPRALFMRANMLGVIVCVLVYALVDRLPWMALVGALLIGTLDAAQRVARIVAIKQYFSAADVRTTVPLTLTAQFIAGGLAGGAMALFRQDMTSRTAMAITVALFATAALAAALLPVLERRQAAISAEPAWSSFVALLRERADLSRTFWAFVAFVSVFQGFFNVSRVTLPAHVLHLSQAFVGLLQAVNSVAALAGALTYLALSRRPWRLHPLPMAAISSVFMVSAAAAIGVSASYVSYFFYIFFFELAFFRLQADVVIETPAERMPLVASMQYAGVYAGMISAIAIGGMLVEAWGLLVTGLVFGCTYAMAVTLGRRWFRPAVSTRTA